MPSFLDLFTKNAFSTNGVSDDSMLEAIAKRDWGDNYKTALDAWRAFSEGLANVVAADIDQYGPYRSGPAYPLVFTQTQKELTPFPAVPWANHPGFGIWRPIYADTAFADARNTVMRLRHVSDVYDCFERGVQLLKAKDCLSASQNEQIGVADYIRCCYKTAMHVMQWNIAKRLLLTPEDQKPQDAASYLLEALSLTSGDKNTLADYMRSVAEAETRNVNYALELHKNDSRLGFEASMEYVFDQAAAEWKNKTTQDSLDLLEKEISNT
jgi:hypothetical protein